MSLLSSDRGISNSSVFPVWCVLINPFRVLMPPVTTRLYACTFTSPPAAPRPPFPPRPPRPPPAPPAAGAGVWVVSGGGVGTGTVAGAGPRPGLAPLPAAAGGATGAGVGAGAWAHDQAVTPTARKSAKCDVRRFIEELGGWCGAGNRGSNYGSICRPGGAVHAA